MAVGCEHMPLVFFACTSIHLAWGFCSPTTFSLWISCLQGIRHILESVVEHLVCLLLQLKIALHRRDQPSPPSCLFQFANVSWRQDQRSNLKKKTFPPHIRQMRHTKITLSYAKINYSLVKLRKILLTSVLEFGFDPTTAEGILIT